MDRRHLLRLTGTMGIGATFIRPQDLLAAGECERINTDNGELTTEQAGATLQFWIDGLHFGDRSKLASRANVTLFMDLKQTPNSFVESVVLMDENQQTLGARYFDSSMKMTSGHTPYVTFENVTLDHKKTYYTTYSVRNGNTVKLYNAAIKNPEISRLNTHWLPEKMRKDFSSFFSGNQVNPTPGLITTQWQYYTENGLKDHTARGRIAEISGDGEFKMNIDFMHGDIDANHYMRYFIVMDPVGRLLGFEKRKFGDAGAPYKTVSRLTDEQIQTWGVDRLQVADIRDCPYIQFYTEDSFDAVARSILRLR